MGSKVRIVDSKDRNFGKFGYVCDWKCDNDSGIVAVLVQVILSPDMWLDLHENIWYIDSQIQEVN